VHHEVTARRTKPVRELGSKNARSDVGAFAIESACKQLRVRPGTLAEGNEMLHACRTRVICNARELTTVAIEHRRPATLEAKKNLRFGVGNCIDGGKKLQMNRLDCGDDGDVRAHQTRERLDLAGMIHAELKDGKTRSLRAPRKRERNAKMIVVGGGGGVG